MDLDELARLTSEFGDAADELNAAARRAGQGVPGVPLELQPGADPLRPLVARVLALQEEVVALLGPASTAAVPLQSVTVGLVVPPGAATRRRDRLVAPSGRGAAW